MPSTFAPCHSSYSLYPRKTEEAGIFLDRTFLASAEIQLTRPKPTGQANSYNAGGPVCKHFCPLPPVSDQQTALLFSVALAG